LSPQNPLLVRNSNATMSIEVATFNGYTPHFNLAWYHNGSKITNNERRIIATNGTSLTITNTVESDAGQYEVKIDSLKASHLNSSIECDGNLLPLLENLAANAPATFLLQKHNHLVYTPESINTIYSIPLTNATDQETLIITSPRVQTNLTYWLTESLTSLIVLRDGQQVNRLQNHVIGFNPAGGTQFTHILYTNSQDIIGSYVQITYIQSLLTYIALRCPYDYYLFLQTNSLDFSPIVVQYWTIASPCKNSTNIAVTCKLHTFLSSICSPPSHYVIQANASVSRRRSYPYMLDWLSK